MMNKFTPNSSQILSLVSLANSEFGMILAHTGSYKHFLIISETKGNKTGKPEARKNHFQLQAFRSSALLPLVFRFPKKYIL